MIRILSFAAIILSLNFIKIECECLDSHGKFFERVQESSQGNSDDSDKLQIDKLFHECSIKNSCDYVLENPEKGIVRIRSEEKIEQDMIGEVRNVWVKLRKGEIKFGLI